MPTTAELRRREKKIIHTPPPEEKLPEIKPSEKEQESKVRRRRRVSPEELRELMPQPSTASEKLKKIVGKPEAIEKAEEFVDEQVLNKLEKAWERVFKIRLASIGIIDFYKLSLERVQEAEVQQKLNQPLIQAFVEKVLPKFEGEEEFTKKAGVFLTTLISLSPEQSFSLDLTELSPLDYLGYKLKSKKLVIFGDVGNLTGYYAHSGGIVINGNAGNETGRRLKGAEIIVEGDAGDYTATFAESGSVIVKHNAGNFTGNSLNGAEIIVKGDAGDNTGRKMCHKKSRIVVGGNTGENLAEEAEAGEIHIGGEIAGLGEKIGKNVFITQAGKQLWPKERRGILRSLRK